MNEFDRLKKRVSKRLKKILQNNAQPVSKAVGNLARDIADETVAEVEEVKKNGRSQEEDRSKAQASC